MKEQRVALLEIFAFGPLERGGRASGHGRSRSTRARSIRVRPGPDGPPVLAGRGAFVAAFVVGWRPAGAECEDGQSSGEVSQRSRHEVETIRRVPPDETV